MDTKNSLLPTWNDKKSLLMNASSEKPLQHWKPVESKRILQASEIELHESIMMDLWKFMTDTYGNKWTESFGSYLNDDGEVSDTVHHWAQALSRVPLKSIDRGLIKCIQERKSPFPPTLPEFYQLCERMPWE